MERRRTGGMTVIAVLNIIFGVLEILKGLVHALHAVVSAPDIPLALAAFSLLLLATGIVGLIAGIGLFAPRAWARTLSLVFAGLLILSCALSFLVLPIMASMVTHAGGSLSSYDLTRVMMYSVTHVVLPVAYALLLWVVFHKPAWKSAFAKG